MRDLAYLLGIVAAVVVLAPYYALRRLLAVIGAVAC
jgi:hypothetical protein